MTNLRLWLLENNDRKRDGIAVWTLLVKDATVVPTPFDGDYCGYGRDSRESEGTAELSA
jgi:hypothetical protein